jgi:hypothetical protein
MVKSYALLDENNVVTNTLAFVNPTQYDLDNAIEVNSGSKLIEMTEENWSTPGGLFDGENLWLPQPFPSWVKWEKSHWKAPIEYPQDDNNYRWNEDTLSWDIF